MSNTSTQVFLKRWKEPKGLIYAGDSWRKQAECRNYNPDFFMSFRTRNQAKEICAFCPVKDICGQQVARIFFETGRYVTGVWGGKYHVLPLMFRQLHRRDLALRMLREASSDLIWTGDISDIASMPDREKEETIRDAQNLLSEGHLTHIKDKMYSINSIPSSVIDIVHLIWSELVDTCDDDCNVVLDYEKLKQITGLKTNNSVAKKIQVMSKVGAMTKLRRNKWKLNEELAGREA